MIWNVIFMIRTNCQNILRWSGQNANQKVGPDKMPTTDKSHGQNANLGWHFVRLAFCPVGILSGWNFVHTPFKILYATKSALTKLDIHTTNQTKLSTTSCDRHSSSGVERGMRTNEMV